MNPPPSQQTLLMLELSFPKQGGHEMGVSPAVGDSTSVDGPTCDLKKCKHFLSTSAVMEQRASNALIRPLSHYSGVEERQVPGV